MSSLVERQIYELNQRFAWLYQSGQMQAAFNTASQALALAGSNLQQLHPLFCESLNNMATAYYGIGNLQEAEQVLLQLIPLRRRMYGSQHVVVAHSLHSLGAVYVAMGDDAKAMSTHHEEQQILLAVDWRQDPALTSYLLNDLASHYRDIGDLIASEQLLLRALEIRRAYLGEEHQDVAQVLNNLGVVYRAMGRLVEAEPLLERSLEIWRSTVGEEDPGFANTLNSLAILFEEKRDYSKAEMYLREAVQILEETIGDEDPQFATSLANQAMMLTYMGNFKKAEPLHIKALEIRRRIIGKKHPDFANSLSNLATHYSMTKRAKEAEPLLREALEIRGASLGKAHPRYASTLTNLASVLVSLKKFTEAEQLYQQALNIRRDTLGAEHSYVATILGDLSTLHAATGQKSEAINLIAQAMEIDDKLTGQVFSLSSERERMAYLQLHRIDPLLSLLIQQRPQKRAEVQRIFDVVLRRKALGAEVFAAQRDAVMTGKYPHLKPKLAELSTLRMQIVQKTQAGSEGEDPKKHEQALRNWRQKKEKLEVELARQIPEMNLQDKLRGADCQAVAQALPDDAALVEFVHFYEFNFEVDDARDEEKWKSPRYLAFVLLAKKPRSVQMVDLGEAGQIDNMIALYREQITGETENRAARSKLDRKKAEGVPEDEGEILRRAIFDPLLPAIRGYKRLFLAPDGELTRLPFEVLPLNWDRYLIDEYELSYLSTGRDVLRFGAESSGPSMPPIVVADPDFDLTAKTSTVSSQSVPSQAAAGTPTSRVSRDFDRSRRHFTRLSGTNEEGKQIALLLGVQPWLEQDALESRIKKLKSPLVLHLATDGFFLADQEQNLGQFRPLSETGGGEEHISNVKRENPLLRSGLVLAGVNTWLNRGSLPAEAEDGILTAEDVSGLDLVATELAVLSACDTGLGEIRTGEGVFGLRRAFVLAGVKTLVMSLWKIPDLETQELMTEYYHRLEAGQGRAQALRTAQLAIKEKYPHHPRYWGAFICQGDPGPLSFDKTT